MNWPLVSASPLPYIEGLSSTPREATLTDLETIRDEFVAAAMRAAAAGFDWLELHCAHGYLLSSFISPLTNELAITYQDADGSWEFGPDLDALQRPAARSHGAA